MLIILAVAALAIGCSDSNMARVTIVIGDHSIAKAEAPSLIDRVLSLFSTRVEAAMWPSAHGALTLIISTGGAQILSAPIPTGATSFSAEVPAGNNLELTVISIADDGYGGLYTNYGASATIDLAPGDDTTVVLTMLQMTKIIYIDGNYGSSVELSWDSAENQGSATIEGYNIYRSTDLNGTYSLVGSKEGQYNTTHSDYLDLVNGSAYFYKISIQTTIGEGIPCDPSGTIYVYNP